MEIIVREIIQLLDIFCIIIFQGPGKGSHKDGDYCQGVNTITRRT